MINLQDLLSKPSTTKQPVIPGISNNRADYGGLSSGFQETPTPPANLGNIGGQSSLQVPERSVTPYEEPKGMFGLKGTIRDVIGTIGDALLVNSGNKRIYGPQRRQEKIGEAMYGYEKDPEEAIRRLAKGGFTEQANELREQMATQKLKQAELKLDQRKDSREQGQFDNDQFEVGLLRGGQIASAMTPDNYPAMKSLYEKFYLSRGLDVPIQLKEEFDKDGIQNVINASMEAKDRLKLELDRTKQADLQEYRRRTIEDRKERTAIQGERASVYSGEASSKQEDRTDRRKIQREGITSREKIAGMKKTGVGKDRNGKTIYRDPSSKSGWSYKKP